MVEVSSYSRLFPLLVVSATLTEGKMIACKWTRKDCAKAHKNPLVYPTFYENCYRSIDDRPKLCSTLCGFPPYSSSCEGYCREWVKNCGIQVTTPKSTVKERTADKRIANFRGTVPLSTHKSSVIHGITDSPASNSSNEGHDHMPNVVNIPAVKILLPLRPVNDPVPPDSSDLEKHEEPTNITRPVLSTICVILLIAAVALAVGFDVERFKDRLFCRVTTDEAEADATAGKSGAMLEGVKVGPKDDSMMDELQDQQAAEKIPLNAG